MRELIRGLQLNERFLELQDEAIKGIRINFFPFLLFLFLFFF